MNNELKELLKLYKTRKFDKAEKKCSNLLKKVRPNHELLNLYAVILFELKKYNKSILQLEKAIQIKPDYVQAYNSLGNVFLKKNEFDDAILNFEKAIKHKPDYYEAISNKANVFFKQKKYSDALQGYDYSISINQNFIGSHEGKARTYRILENFEEAISSWKKVLEIDPMHLTALTQLGDLYFDKNILDHALNNYERALNIQPDKKFLLGNFLHTKMKMCDWNDFEKLIENLKKKIQENKKVSPPYQILTIFDSPALHLKASKLWADEHENEETLPKIKFRDKEKKLKIGYYSADFRTHAMGHLMVKMFEQHDKENFETYGFYFGPNINPNDQISKRIVNSFDKFIDLKLMNDLEVAKISRDLGIDIAIDLMCFTGTNNRFGIFTKKCAPLQVNFLGYPGTSGSGFIDYIVLDNKILNDDNKDNFSEKLIVLPDVYQPNEDTKEVSEKPISKAELNLPENKFIFGCFNSHQKITPHIFKSWIKILNSNEKSVLWLLKDNIYSEKNLKEYFKNNGVNPDRLIFANHLKLHEHLARLKFVDLFLDTFPYNAHTTCSDALRMGVPVLTIEGQSFASRVASSLLSSMNLDELIMKNNKEFELKALELSNDLQKLKLLKEKVVKNKLRTNLFNSKVFTKNLEKSYMAIYENYIKGNEPKNFKL